METEQIRPTVAPPPPRVWTVFLTFAALFVSMLVLSFLLAFLYLLFLALSETASGAQVDFGMLLKRAEEASASPGVMVVSLVLGATMTYVFALVPAALSPTPWRARLRFAPSGLSPATMAVVVLGFFAFGTLFDALGALVGVGNDGSLGRMTQVTTEAGFPLAMLFAVVAGFGSGFAEELFCRGYLQTRLCQRWGRWIGITVAAVLFGLMHMDAIHGIFAFFVGLWLGWVTERTGSVRPAMAAHAFNNIAWFIGVAAFRPPFSPAINAGLLVVLLLVAIGAIAYLRRALPRTAEEPVPAVAPA